MAPRHAQGGRRAAAAAGAPRLETLRHTFRSGSPACLRCSSAPTRPLGSVWQVLPARLLSKRGGGSVRMAEEL